MVPHALEALHTRGRKHFIDIFGKLLGILNIGTCLPHDPPDESYPVPCVPTHPTACLPGRPAIFSHAFVFIVDCFCGEGPPLGDDKREKCNTACENPSSNDACGGETYLALYDIPVPGTVPDPVSDLQLVVDGASDLVGCYPFSDNYGILTDGPFTRWEKMTNEVRTG